MKSLANSPDMDKSRTPPDPSRLSGMLRIMDASDYGLLEEAVRSLIAQRRFLDAQAILVEAAQFSGGPDAQSVLARAMSEAIPKVSA